MQRISSFAEPCISAVLRAAKQVEMAERGLTADTLFMEGSWYVRFTWPDWPKDHAEMIYKEVNQFHQAHPEFHLVQRGSREWLSVSHGWEADYESAEAVGVRFNRHFDGKVAWVESEKDRGGQISGDCLIEGAGKFHFDLSWRSSLILPLGSLKAEEYDAFRQAAREVMEWASSRIQSILDTLKARVQELYGERFRGLYVFGSYARPDAGIQLPIDSDLDVALLLSDFDNPYDERSRIGDLVADLSLEHDIVISLIPVREQDFKEGRTNFTRVISEYAIPV